MKPRDTSAISPEEMLLRSMAEGPSQALESLEAQGQTELCTSRALPSDCNRAEVEALGIKLGEPFKDDPMFCPAELPEGWNVKPTDHSMWSKLVDDKGVERASIFYKAAPYDRSAFLRVNQQENDR